MCEACAGPLPVKARSVTKTCSPRCRQRLSRARRGAGLPAELRSRARWVRYREVRRDGRLTKVPLRINGSVASSTNPDTWCSYAQVRGFSTKGFVLNGDGLVCIDLDKCLLDGQPTGKGAEVLAMIPPTYVEVSPSGTGLHIWGLGHLDHGRRLQFPTGTVELYATGRFMTVTGARFRRCPSSLGDLSGVITALL